MKKDRFTIPILWLLSCAIVFLIAGKVSQPPEKDVPSLGENDSRLQIRRSSGSDLSAGRKSQRQTGRTSLLAANDLEETIDSFMVNDDSLSRSKNLLTFVGQLTAEDYPEFVNALIKKDFDGKLFTDYLFVLRSWTRADPSAAMEFATKERKNKYDKLAVLRHWASYDKEGISQWIEDNVPDVNYRRWDMEEVSYGAREGEFFERQRDSEGG